MALFKSKSEEKDKKKKTNSPFDAPVDERTLHKNLEFTATEQYKMLRTNINFTIPEGVKCPIIGITSSGRGEGKSTTAVNLSYVLAEKGSRTLLIDGDLRIPSVAKKMKIPGSPGLTDVLMEKETHDVERFKSSLLDTWYIMPSGEIPPNPSELLGSKRMKSTLMALSEHFDYIILDLPPVNIVTDAVSVSGFVTGMVLVVREEHTEKKEFERCFRQLKLSNVNVLGCVINGAKSGAGHYGKYGKKSHYYYKYRYYKKSDKDDSEKPKEKKK